MFTVEILKADKVQLNYLTAVALGYNPEIIMGSLLIPDYYEDGFNPVENLSDLHEILEVTFRKGMRIMCYTCRYVGDPTSYQASVKDVVVGGSSFNLAVIKMYLLLHFGDAAEIPEVLV